MLTQEDLAAVRKVVREEIRNTQEEHINIYGPSMKDLMKQEGSSVHAPEQESENDSLKRGKYCRWCAHELGHNDDSTSLWVNTQKPVPDWRCDLNFSHSNCYEVQCEYCKPTQPHPDEPESLESSTGWIAGCATCGYFTYAPS